MCQSHEKRGMNIRHLGCLIVNSIFLACAAEMRAAVVYSVDDGTPDAGLGSGAAGTAFTYANQFTATAGGEKIESVQIAWANAAINGWATEVKLWSDPNQDGIPHDSVLLSSLSSTVSLGGTGNFATYDIPDVTFTLGEKFFVGFTIIAISSVNPVVYADTSGPIDHASWSKLATDLSTASLFPGFDTMIRATGAVVPEPSTFFFGVAVVGCITATRSRAKSS